MDALPSRCLASSLEAALGVHRAGLPWKENEQVRAGQSQGSHAARNPRRQASLPVPRPSDPQARRGQEGGKGNDEESGTISPTPPLTLSPRVAGEGIRVKGAQSFLKGPDV